MRFTIFHLLMLCCCLHAGLVLAAEPLPLKQGEGAWPTDRTVTVAGHDFFQTFAMLWQEQPLSERYAIVIREYPSARRGTQVTIDYGQERVCQTLLPANRAKIAPLAREAVASCYRNVIDAEVRQLLFRDADLASNEI
jgi:hypothetical protein